MMQRSRYLLTLPTEREESTHVPTVRAHGDQDDHLRITVLLAAQFRGRVASDLYETCTKRNTPWKKRKEALKQLLKEAQEEGQGTIVRLIDPDALDMGELLPETRWKDAAFRRERSELFALLLDRIADHGWELIRPEPCASTTSKLEERDCEVVMPPASKDGATPDEERLAAIADAVLLPALRPLAESLVVNQRLSARDLARRLEAASSPSRAGGVLLSIASDFLSVDGVEAGERLSLLRGPHSWNGVAGPFLRSGDDSEWLGRLDCVPREPTEELVRGGWLQLHPGTSATQFTMSNAVRQFLQQRALLTDPDRRLREHDHLARLKPTGIRETVEAHHHAVESGDDVLARDTAQYYGADLRQIAYARSTKKDATAADFAAAAEIYRVIVDEFDSEDAYAWHYRGYNMAMQYRSREHLMSPQLQRDIADAYAAASRCDPSNPLYRGREIGFWARIGRDVQPQLLRNEMMRFQRVSGRKSKVIFAQRVLEGMSSVARLMLAREPWAGDLVRDQELEKFFR